MRRGREARDLDHQIQISQQRLSELRIELDRELQKLRAQKARAANNLAGAIYEQSVSNEMTAVKDNYSAQIDAEKDKLADLRAKRSALK